MGGRADDDDDDGGAIQRINHPAFCIQISFCMDFGGRKQKALPEKRNERRKEIMSEGQAGFCGL
jgi:hypothetical protein